MAIDKDFKAITGQEITDKIGAISKFAYCREVERSTGYTFWSTAPKKVYYILISTMKALSNKDIESFVRERFTEIAKKDLGIETLDEEINAIQGTFPFGNGIEFEISEELFNKLPKNTYHMLCDHTAKYDISPLHRSTLQEPTVTRRLKQKETTVTPNFTIP